MSWALDALVVTIFPGSLLLPGAAIFLGWLIAKYLGDSRRLGLSLIVYSVVHGLITSLPIGVLALVPLIVVTVRDMTKYRQDWLVWIISWPVIMVLLASLGGIDISWVMLSSLVINTLVSKYSYVQAHQSTQQRYRA